MAMRAGFLKIRACRCGSEKSNAHHDDYAKPFSVRWLCARCHFHRHVKLGWGFKGERGDEAVKFDKLSMRAFKAAKAVLASRASFRRSFSLLTQPAK